MNPSLNAYALPSLVAPEELAGGTVVVIDVLRASTTIVHALEAGAAEVIPCLEVDDARRATAQLPEETAILGGERGGRPIDGFDLGNSPDQYTAERVRGRTVVFTTTNGTRAMSHCRQADRVLIGAFVNAAAVCRRLVGCERIHLLCAGSRGQYTRDDTLLAGLLIERVLQQSGTPYQLNAQAATAQENWRAAFPKPVALGAEPLEPERLAAQLAASAAGQCLREIGLERDVLTAAQLDRFEGVPELDPSTFRIRLA